VRQNIGGSHLLICQCDAKDLVCSNLQRVNRIKKIEGTIGHYELVIEVESKNEKHFERIIYDYMRNIELVH
jgi:hypothetical protein